MTGAREDGSLSLHRREVSACPTCSRPRASARSPRATASSSRRCASTARPMAWATTGTCSISALAPWAGRASCSPRRPMSRRSGGSRRAASACGTPAHQHLLGRLAALIARGGAVPGMQLAHAGRKGSSARPWEGGKGLSVENGGWVPVGPSAISFGETHTTPHELSVAEIAAIAAAVRRDDANGPRGRVPDHRNPRRPRLPDPFLPFADFEPPRRRLWRRPRRTVAAAVRGGGGGAQRMAGRAAAVRAAVRGGLDGGRAHRSTTRSRWRRG